MKKILFLIAFFLTISLNAQIKISSNGWVGIGDFWEGSARRLFDVNGHAQFSCYPASCGFYFENYSAYPIISPQWDNALYLGSYDKQLRHVYTRILHVNGIMVTSDKKLKENIRPLTGSLENILKLKPVKYDFKAELYEDSLCFDKEELLANRKDHSGFIAQEVQTVFPKFVEYNKDADILEINYAGFIPELVNAVKEQQQIIESLQLEIQDLKSQNIGNNLKNLKIENPTTSTTSDNALYQNSPNPFSHNTNINYSLSDNAQKAMICIYDMSGKQLKCYMLEIIKNGDITINGGELNAGMYMYSLIVDGQLIDTKTMILTN